MTGLTEPREQGLREADFRGCRWIEGKPTPLHPGMFCCAPTLSGGSWCAKHRKIVWAYRRTSRPRQLSPSGASRHRTLGAEASAEGAAEGCSMRERKPTWTAEERRLKRLRAVRLLGNS
jgi:hypothetical protein